MKVDYPRPVDPFFLYAQRKVLQLLRHRVPIVSAVLDDWGGAIRIIYEIRGVEECNDCCETCRLFIAVGEDPAVLKHNWFTPTLVRTPPEYFSVISAKQRYLNCKSLGQYSIAFVEYVVAKCTTPEILRAELRWIAQFRILYFQDRSDLVKIEKEIKLGIIKECLTRLKIADPARYEFIVQETQKLNIFPGHV